MRSIIRKSMLLAGGCLVCGAATAVSAGAATLDVKVPFPFKVSGETLPAGEYTLQWNNRSSSVLLIEGKDGNHAGSFVMTAPPRRHDSAGPGAALTFTRYENQYRLSGVRDSDRDDWSIVSGR